MLDGISETSIILHGSYDFRLVAVSVVLAMAAAYAALDLAGRVTAAQGRAKWFWLAGGASAMGVGIWAMHYVGMLAWLLPVPVLYHYPTVIVSLGAAVLASAIALFTVSRARLGIASCVIGSLAMGGGIVVMHYIGMEAMRLPATIGCGFCWLDLAGYSPASAGWARSGREALSSVSLSGRWR